MLRVRTVGQLGWRRLYSGDINRGGGKFGEREHAQEEQYFRKKVKGVSKTGFLKYYCGLRSGKRLKSIVKD